MNENNATALLCLFIIFIAVCFGIICYGIVEARAHPRCDLHQIHMIKMPYVKGDMIISDHLQGGLAPDGQVTDTVCVNKEYTVMFISKNGTIKSTFYPTKTTYVFHVDEQDKPIFDNGILPDGTTTYTFKKPTDDKWETLRVDEGCAHFAGKCVGESCEIKIVNTCEYER